MDGLSLLADAAAAGLVVTAAGDKLLIRGPRSTDALARRLIEHKVAVMAALTTVNNVYVYETSTNTKKAESFVDVDNVDTPGAILPALHSHGLDMVQEPTGRVYVAGPPEAVTALPAELVAAMEANWPAFRRLAAPAPTSYEEIDLPNPCATCGSLEVWWPIAGNPRCIQCDPPLRGMKLLERAARLRQQRFRPSYAVRT